MAIYSDINQFKPTSVIQKVDAEAVYQSISNILGTPQMTRFFNPEFGSQLDQLLFEPMSEDTASMILKWVMDAVNRWDPRVRFDVGKSSVLPDYDNNKYSLILYFEIEGLSGQNFEYRGLVNS